MKILICDDEAKQCELLAELLREQIRGKVGIDTASSREEMQTLLDKQDYSVIFMDIELGEDVNGIELAKEIKERRSGCSIVFITGYIRYCEDIFYAGPDALMLKPFSEENVKRVLEIIRRKKELSDSVSIAVGKRQLEKISLDNISYIETKARYLIFHDSDYRQAYRFYDIKMSDIAEKMPANFLWCHKSFFVNIDFVTGIERFKFRMKGGNEIPISQKRYPETKKLFLEYLEDSI